MRGLHYKLVSTVLSAKENLSDIPRTIEDKRKGSCRATSAFCLHPILHSLYFIQPFVLFCFSVLISFPGFRFLPLLYWIEITKAHNVLRFWCKMYAAWLIDHLSMRRPVRASVCVRSRESFSFNLLILSVFHHAWAHELYQACAHQCTKHSSLTFLARCSFVIRIRWKPLACAFFFLNKCTLC